jgi:hypothetical protein
MSLLDNIIEWFGGDAPERQHLHHDHPNKAVWIHYTNHRGELAWRLVRPKYIGFGQSNFHPERQWFMRAKDLKRDVDRDFAMKDIHTWVASDNHDTPPKVVLLPSGVTVEVK